LPPTVPARRNQPDSVGCETPTSLDSSVAVMAFGPVRRSIILALNPSVYVEDIVSKAFFSPLNEMRIYRFLRKKGEKSVPDGRGDNFS
jgi:hypothetical protein